MPIADRLIAGQRLSERLIGRADKTSVAGGSVGFRARFGLLPEGAASSPEVVSAAPWAAMMARLSDARSRLMNRGERFFEQHGEHRLGALGRMWPEARQARFAWDSGGVYRGEMVLPEAYVDESGEEVEAAAASGAPRKAFVPHRPVANAWGRSSDRAARVVRAVRRSADADERAGAVVSRNPKAAPAALRAPTVTRAPKRARALDRAASRIRETSLIPPSGGRSGGSMSRNETSRAAMTRLAAPRTPTERMMSAARQSKLPDRAVSPVSVAASRLPSAGHRHRGLRSSVIASPLVQVVTAAPETASQSGLTVSSPPAESSVSPKRAPATRQAGARAVKTASRRLSASPVARASRPAASRRRAAPPTAPRRTGSGSFVSDRSTTAAAAASVPARSARATPTGVDALIPGPGAIAIATARPAISSAARGSATRRGSGDQNAPTGVLGANTWRSAAAHAAARMEPASGGRSLLRTSGASSAANAGGSGSFDAVGARTLSPTLSALARADAGASDSVLGGRSVLASPVSGARKRADAGLLADRGAVGRAFSVRKMASGVFGPDQVVLDPTPEDATEPAAEPRAAKRQTVPPKVVSGFGTSTDSSTVTPAVQAAAARAKTASTRRDGSRSASSSASATRHALARGANVAGGRSVLPRVTPGQTLAATPAAARTAATATEAGGTNAARSTSAVRRAAARQQTLRATGGSLLPAPLAHLGRRMDTASADRGSVRRVSVVAPDQVVPAARAEGAPTAEGATSATASTVARTSGTRPTASAAARATRVATKSGAVRRAVSGPTPGLSRRSRPGPMSHARRTASSGAVSALPVVELDATTARSLGLFDRGVQLAGSGEWLVDGDLASAVQRAAARTPAAAARRGASRASVLRGLAPALDVLPGESPAGGGHADDSPQGDGGAGSAFGGGSTAPVRVAVPGRPLDWADGRGQSATSAAGADSARGGHTARTASGRFLPARRLAGSVGPTAGSAARIGSDRPMLSSSATRRGGPVRSRSSIGAPDAVLPQSVGLGPAGVPGDGSQLAGHQPGLPGLTFQPGMPAASNSLGGLPGVLDAVESGKADSHLPVWAQRASGKPLIRGSQGSLVHALARADTPEDVVRVIVQQGAAAVATSTLPKPVTEVIGQISDKAAAEVRNAQTQAARDSAAQPVDPKTGRPRSTTRVVRGITGLRRGRSARAESGVGPDQVSRLAKKLQGLIHLAEGVGDRDAARRQVRMAEDSSAARAEGQGGGASRPADDLQDKVDIDALSQEVLEAVNRELELRRERRQEESDERSFWW